MKIAFIGQKGIPARWGGVETHVDELASRLALRGHDVTVYVRNWYTPKEIKLYKKIHLKHTFCIYTKHLDAISHSLFSSIDSLFNSFDIIHYHAMGPTLSSWIPAAFHKKIVATIHRLDYESDKWKNVAKMILKLSEKFALSIPASTITVSRHLYKLYKDKGYDTVYIPNGVKIPDIKKPKMITKKYGLRGKDYILYMGRIVPEKRCDLLIKAYYRISKKNNGLKLIIAGDSSASSDYVKKVKETVMDENVIFTGFVTGIIKEELLSNAQLYVIPSYLEGLPISLLEAASYKLVCLASDIVPHKEIIDEGSDGFFFIKDNLDDLVDKLNRITSFSPKKMESIGEKARENVREKYRWDYVVNQTEKLYFDVLGK